MCVPGPWAGLDFSTKEHKATFHGSSVDLTRKIRVTTLANLAINHLHFRKLVAWSNQPISDSWGGQTSQLGERLKVTNGVKASQMAEFRGHERAKGADWYCGIYIGNWVLD